MSIFGPGGNKSEFRGDREKGNKLSHIRPLFQFILPYKRAVFGAILALTVSAAAVLAMGVGLRMLIDRGLGSENIEFLNEALVYLICMVLLLAASTFSRFYIGDYLSDAVIVVPDQQLSLAIGKEGQNARLCAKLSGLMVNIKSLTEVGEERLSKPAPALEVDVASAEVEESSISVEDVIGSEVEALGVASDPIDTNNVQSIDKVEEQVGIEGLSIEEQLAEVLVDDGSVEETGDSAEVPVLTEISETVWDIPKAPEQPQTIRFAEDIMGAPKANTSPRRKGRAGKATGTNRTGEERSSRNTKKSRRNDFSMDEGDDLMDDDLGDLV